MFNSKKGRMMRHPYATLAVIGLATAGAISIVNMGKRFVKEKSECVKDAVRKMKSY